MDKEEDPREVRRPAAGAPPGARGGRPARAARGAPRDPFERVGLIMDDSFVDAFAACAADKDPAVRKAVAQTLGSVGFGVDESAEADGIGMLLRLTEDDDFDVRYDAVYYGLSPLPEERRGDVIRRLLAMALELTATDRATSYGRCHARADRLGPGAGSPRCRAGPQRGPPRQRPRACPGRAGDLQGHDRPDASRRPADAETRAGYATALGELHEHLRTVYPNFNLKGRGSGDRRRRGRTFRGPASRTGSATSWSGGSSAGLEASLDQALASLGPLNGLVLDVRGNSGGGFETSTAFRNFDLAPDASLPKRRATRAPSPW